MARNTRRSRLPGRAASTGASPSAALPRCSTAAWRRCRRLRRAPFRRAEPGQRQMKSGREKSRPFLSGLPLTGAVQASPGDLLRIVEESFLDQLLATPALQRHLLHHMLRAVVPGELEPPANGRVIPLEE